MSERERIGASDAEVDDLRDCLHMVNSGAVHRLIDALDAANARADEAEREVARLRIGGSKLAEAVDTFRFAYMGDLATVVIPDALAEMEDAARQWVGALTREDIQTESKTWEQFIREFAASLYGILDLTDEQVAEAVEWFQSSDGWKPPESSIRPRRTGPTQLPEDAQ